MGALTISAPGAKPSLHVCHCASIPLRRAVEDEAHRRTTGHVSTAALGDGKTDVFVDMGPKAYAGADGHRKMSTKVTEDLFVTD